MMRIKYLIAFIGLLYLPAGLALTLNGYTAFESVLELNASVNGVVKSIKVVPGQRINRGDILLELDVTPYQARVDRAIAIEKALLPVVETAELELERAAELYDRDSLSQVSLKKAENELAMAQGNYQAALADRVLAEYQLANTVIVSPINGRVLDLFTNINQFVDPSVSNSPLVTVVNSQHMKAIGLINSEQWKSSLLAKKARVSYQQQNFSGEVSYLGYKRIKQASGLPAYEIHVLFETDKLIPAEMPVAIEIKE